MLDDSTSIVVWVFIFRCDNTGARSTWVGIFKCFWKLMHFTVGYITIFRALSDFRQRC